MLIDRFKRGAGANRASMAEGDFQRPARQLTSSALEREVTLVGAAGGLALPFGRLG